MRIFFCNPSFMADFIKARPMLSQRLQTLGRVAGVVSTGVGGYQLSNDWKKYKTNEDKATAAICFGIGAIGNLGGGFNLISAAAGAKYSAGAVAAKFFHIINSNDYEFVRGKDVTENFVIECVKVLPSVAGIKYENLGACLQVCATAHDISSSSAIADSLKFASEAEKAPQDIALICVSPPSAVVL